MGVFFVLLYNLIILGGTVFLIDQRGWSPWTGLVCLFLLASYKRTA